MNRTRVIGEEIRQWLAVNGPAKAETIGHALQVSQPTVSRGLRQLGRSLIRIGRARATEYALVRPLENAPSEVPIYRIDGTGECHAVATLHSILREGFLCTGLTPRALRTPDLPYFLEDLCPSGFLGRFIPARYPMLQAPHDIRLWNATHCLRYLTYYGWDLPGDLLLGEGALQLYQQYHAHPPAVVPADHCVPVYESMAADVAQSGVPGSSAAGEQPKFLTCVGDRRTPVLVKFSPPRTDATSLRIADLLICEHIAHVVLRAHGQSAATSRIHVGPTRTFLEVERFDRTAEGGRRGVISLQALDLGHDGVLRSWQESADSLYRGQVVTAALRDEIQWLEYFGRCIANTDMHGGNCAFFTSGVQPTALAPTYDMLPMAYYPPHRPTIPIAIPAAPPQLARASAHAVQRAAHDFWTQVSTDPRITDDFRILAEQHRVVFRHIV